LKKDAIIEKGTLTQKGKKTNRKKKRSACATGKTTKKTEKKDLQRDRKKAARGGSAIAPDSDGSGGEFDRTARRAQVG